MSLSVRRKRYRAVRFFKKLLTFALSRAGLCAFMVGYMMIGAVVFKEIEAPFEREVRNEVAELRHRYVDIAYRLVYVNGTRDPRAQADYLVEQLLLHKRRMLDCIKHGYNVKDAQAIERPQWTTTGAFLYSLTVITTVGYGNIACRTYFGKAITILYAVVGIPLMLLFLAMTGNSLGMTTKFLYRAYQRLKLRLQEWRNRRRKAGKVTSVLSQLIRERLYYSAAIYGVVPPGVDVDLLNDTQAKVREIVVPVYLSMLIMISYLMAGALLFSVWEEWSFLDSFYFCFISLALIGFGDMFPGRAVADKVEAKDKMIMCSCYLLFGMALIAMCFQLGQEDVVKNLRILMAKLSVCLKKNKDGLAVVDENAVNAEELVAAAKEIVHNMQNSNGSGHGGVAATVLATKDFANRLDFDANHYSPHGHHLTTVRRNGAPSCSSNSPASLHRRPSNRSVARKLSALRRRSSVR